LPVTQPRHDYYEVLGVPRTADEEEIRKAYLALARTLHPDVSDEPDAGERFREVTAAYSVLSKPTARFLYDRFGYRGRGGGFGPGAARGDSRVIAEVEIDPVEAGRGTRREVLLAADDECELCGGTGAVPGTGVRVCETCGGKGRVRVSAGLGVGRLLQIERCADCGGLGRFFERACAECRGQGRVTSRRVLKVRIPPGVEDGTRLRIMGEPEENHLLVRILPGPMDSPLVRWTATLLLAFAIGLLAYFLVWP
jgi:molecular chaperone DnaJ